jgi:hypothetical protein
MGLGSPSSFRSPDPVQHRAPRKRERDDRASQSSALSAASSSLPSTASPYYAAAMQQGAHGRARSRTGREERTKNQLSNDAQSQTDQQTIKQVVNQIVLRKRELFNPAVGQREEVCDNMSDGNARSIRPRQCTQQKRVGLSDPVFWDAVVYFQSRILDVRRDFPDPELRRGVLEKELRALLSKAAGRADVRTHEGTLAYRKAIREATDEMAALARSRRMRKMRRTEDSPQKLPPTRLSDPQGVHTIRIKGQIIPTEQPRHTDTAVRSNQRATSDRGALRADASGNGGPRNNASGGGGPKSDVSDPYSNISDMEVEMIHHYILPTR